MKTCIAQNCRYPVFSHNYCKSHQYMRKDAKYDRRTPYQKYIDNIDVQKKKEGKQLKKQLAELIKRDVGGEQDKYSLKEWFAYHMANSPRRCENCGSPLGHYKYWDWYSSHHHILEKSLFPSVQSELENHAVLGMWCCHPVWHSSYEIAMQMPIWNLCVQRVQPILYLVKEKHKILDLFNGAKNIPQLLLNELI